METLISILLFGAFFFFMMRYGCGGHMSHEGGHGEHDSHTHGSGSASKDPVCGMEVSPESGYARIVDGKEYRFCSRRCMDEFEASPNRYAA